ncbi:MAG TPA: EamA family transporter [Methylophilaceae bacterium]|nr:EamA family transporter [Methylophilaceae bacterium]
MQNHIQARHAFAGTLMVLVSSVAFSSKAILVKLAYAYHIDAASLIALRMAFSIPFFIGLMLWLRYTSVSTKLSRDDVIMLVFLGAVAGYGSMWLNFAGLQYVTAGLERVILFLYPTLVVLLSVVLHQHRITKYEVIALIASYAGVILVVGHDLSMPTAAASHILLGAGLVLGSAIVYALYLVLSGKLIPRLGALLFTAYTMSIASIASGVHFIATEPISAVMYLPLQVYWLSFVMALVATVLPSILLNMGIHRIGSNKASLVSSVGPVSTIFLAWIFLGESITLLQVVGTALVLLGVLAISLSKK